MADIALDALRAGASQLRPGSRHNLLPSLVEGQPVVADVWIDGSLGFVLVVHRRGDGFVSEELYYSMRNDDGDWLSCEHVSGSILGLAPQMSEALKDVPGGSSLAVVSESEALLHTGRREAEDGYEPVRALTVLVGEDADRIAIEDHSQGSATPGGQAGMDVRSPLILLVLLPGRQLRVSALHREGSYFSAIGDPMEVFSSEP
jgi:hypothetical protein